MNTSTADSVNVLVRDAVDAVYELIGYAKTADSHMFNSYGEDFSRLLRLARNGPPAKADVVNARIEQDNKRKLKFVLAKLKAFENAASPLCKEISRSMADFLAASESVDEHSTVQVVLRAVNTTFDLLTASRYLSEAVQPADAARMVHWEAGHWNAFRDELVSVTLPVRAELDAQLERAFACAFAFPNVVEEKPSWNSDKKIIRFRDKEAHLFGRKAAPAQEEVLNRLQESEWCSPLKDAVANVSGRHVIPDLNKSVASVGLVFKPYRVKGIVTGIRWFPEEPTNTGPTQ